MKATNYRIGNLVEFLGETRTILGISNRLRPDVGYFEFEGFKNDFKGIHVKPISLDEDWIMRFGFSSAFSSDPQEPNASKVYSLDSLKIHQPDKDKQEFTTCINYEMDELEIKYVHQLQNLYAVITNMELEFAKE